MRTAWAVGLVLSTVALVVMPAIPLQAQSPPSFTDWGDWAVAVDRPQPLDPETSAQSRESSDLLVEGRDEEDALARSMLTYDLWQWSISSLSSLGPISPIQGRREVLLHAADIIRWAPHDLELIVAASIAHQASDFKDRPFGTDAIEVVWSELIDDNISVGIAQLRRAEVVQWAPFLPNVDLLAPEVAIRIMTAKLNQANAYIRQSHPELSITDRYMLLALAQNASAFGTIRYTVDYFFDVAGGDWAEMLASEPGTARNWRMQLRLVLLHLDWLVEQGWPVPGGLDRDYWALVAFAEPE